MKVYLPASVLKTAISTMTPILPTNSPKPILQSVKLAVTDSGATLIANNLDQAVEYTLPGVSVEEAGEAILLPKKILSIVNTLNATDQVEISTLGGKVVVKSGKGVWRFPEEDPAIFPSPPVASFKNGFIVDYEPLLTAIRHTTECTDPNSTRYALGGVLSDVSSDHLDLVATDGRRLALCKLPINPTGEITEKPVVPTAALNLLSKLKGEQSVDVAVTLSHTTFRTSQAVIHTRNMEGWFPKWEDVLPQSSLITATVDAKEFSTLLKSASITLTDESRGVHLQFSTHQITATSKAADAGDSVATCDRKPEEGVIGITVDPRFVVPQLEGIDGEISIGMTTPKAAMLFRLPACQLVVMPLTPEA